MTVQSDRSDVGGRHTDDEPGFFMLFILKLHGVDGIFQKHRLKYVLSIRMIF